MCIAQGMVFHADCFTCDDCNARIAGPYFQTSTGGKVCKSCKEKDARVCAGCSQRITSGEKFTVISDGVVLHKRCFVCCRCRVRISDAYVTGPDGPCCMECHDAGGAGLERTDLRCDGCGLALAGTFTVNGGKNLCAICVPRVRCEGCKEEVEGQVTHAGGKSYHPECFVCQQCSAALRGQFFIQDGRRVCNACLA